MGAMFDTLLRLYHEYKLTENGLTNAVVVMNWIKEDEKLSIIASKPVDILPPDNIPDETPEHLIETEIPLVKIEPSTEEITE